MSRFQILEVVSGASWASSWLVLPPEKFRTSSKRLPADGLYQNGVVSVMMISNSFGPAPDPEKALDRDSAPLETTVSSAPMLSAKVLLKLLACRPVVESLIWTLVSVSVK